MENLTIKLQICDKNNELVYAIDTSDWKLLLTALAKAQRKFNLPEIL